MRKAARLEPFPALLTDRDVDMTGKPKLEVIHGGRADLERRILKLLLQSFGSADKDRSEFDRLVAILRSHADLSVVSVSLQNDSDTNNKDQGGQN